MARILITSGPTRQYLDPVRYLTNASSGRMGCALAEAILAAGHQPVVVSGPVEIDYPAQAEVVSVVTTEEMLDASRELFAECDGMIGVAAPCDYRPVEFAEHKIAKNGQTWHLPLVETPDVLAALGADKKPSQWLVAFALETQNGHERAMGKLRRKNANWIVLNGPEAICEQRTCLEVLDGEGAVLARLEGTKRETARALFELIETRLLQANGSDVDRVEV